MPNVLALTSATQLNPWTTASTMTLSGNEITDAVRAAGVQGDGRAAPDGSIGIWPFSTNLITNGGFESNLTGLTTQGTGVITLTRDATFAKFGGYSAKVACNGAASGQGCLMLTPTGQGLLNFSFVSAWVFSATGGEQLTYHQRIIHTDASVKDGTTTNITLVAGWQRLTPPETNVTAAKTGDQTGIRIVSQIATQLNFWVDGVQAEKFFGVGSAVAATPYIHTNGATVTRPVGLVSAPSSGIGNLTGWFAVRLRMGLRWQDLNAVVVRWFDTFPGDHRLLEIQGQLIIMDLNVNTASTTLTYAAGDIVTLIGTWTPTNIGLSVNGGNFTNQAYTGQLAVTAPTFTIGSGASSEGELQGDIFWFAAGVGTLNNTDAAAIGAYPNTSTPILTSWPGTASMVWMTSVPNYSHYGLSAA